MAGSRAYAFVGGKGTVRRKIVRKTKPSTAQDDKKLQGALKKLNVQPIPGVEEVNMFREDGNVLHFSTPKGTSRDLYPDYHAIPVSIALRGTGSCTTCATTFAYVYASIFVADELILSCICCICHTVHAAVTANTFAVYGAGHVKELTELVPGILNQLGPDSLASLRKLAESYQAIQQSQQRPPAAAADDDDDDVPDLVENFDAVEDKPAEAPADAAAAEAAAEGEGEKKDLEDLN